MKTQDSFLKILRKVNLLKEEQGLSFSKPQKPKKDQPPKKVNPYQHETFEKDFTFTDLQTFLTHDWGTVTEELKQWLETRKEFDGSNGLMVFKKLELKLNAIIQCELDELINLSHFKKTLFREFRLVSRSF